MIKCLLFVFLFSVHSFANTFVGNPGTAVDINGALYVSDLFSLGVAENPYIGSNLEQRFLDQPKFPFEVPTTLLAQKLSDIEAAIPGLGSILLQTMKELNWSSVDEDLVLISNDPDPIQLPPGAFKVQVANRFQILVRVNSKAWARLNAAHRVALVIHETVYSLITPQSSGRFYYQSSQKARDLTGQFFLESLSGSSMARDLMKNPKKYGLSLPVLEVPTMQRFLSISLLTGYVQEGEWSPTITNYRVLNIPRDKAADFYQVLSASCASALQKSERVENFKSLSIDLTINWAHLQPTFNFYPASKTETQVVIQYEMTIDTLFLSRASPQSVDECVLFGQKNFDRVVKTVQ